MGSPVVPALCAVLVVGAVVSAVRLAVRPKGATYLGGRSSDTAHLLMNASMAATLVVPPTVLPQLAVVVLYVAIAVVFAGLVALGLLRPDPARRLHRPAHIYHVIAASAMAWAVHLMPADTAGTAHVADMPEMPGMPGTAASLPVAVWILAALFALDALGTLALLRRVTDRLAVVPHIIMDVGMVAMLVPTWLTASG